MGAGLRRCSASFYLSQWLGVVKVQKQQLLQMLQTSTFLHSSNIQQNIIVALLMQLLPTINLPTYMPNRNINYQHMFGSRVTVIEGHNKFQSTDQLYEPLRKTFMLDTTARKTQLEEISHFSHISHSVKTHTAIENIQLAEHTFIPEDVKLKPTHHFWKIPKDHQYYIINAQYKQYDPISEEEMARLLSQQKSKDEIIVYEIEGIEDEADEGEKASSANKEGTNWNFYPVNSHRFKEEEELTQMATVRKNNINQEATSVLPKIQHQVSAQNETSKQKSMESKRKNYSKELKKKGSGLMLTQRKYNFFSALDEPINNLLTGKACTCPANQIVADQINQISWYGAKLR